MRRAARLLPLALLTQLAACETGGNGKNVGAAAGGIGGIAVGGITSNPAIGYAVGLAIRTLVDAAFDHWLRGLKQTEQDSIAALAGSLPPGEPRPWTVEHGLPFGWRDAMGTMEVTRVIETPLASCREVIFSVAGEREDGPPEGIFATTLCRQTRGWKWATAEPAVDRWGALQ